MRGIKSAFGEDFIAIGSTAGDEVSPVFAILTSLTIDSVFTQPLQYSWS